MKYKGWCGESSRHAQARRGIKTKLYKERIKGGLADGLPDSCFNKKKLQEGVKVELEHTKDGAVAKEIAKDHLVEHEDYYKRLKKARL